MTDERASERDADGIIAMAIHSFHPVGQEPPPFKPRDRDQEAKEQLATRTAIEAAQNTYLSASGTLTQFNAILAAIQGAAISAGSGAARTAMSFALLLHVLAAFLLCWAARPIEAQPRVEARFALFHSRALVDDTFRNYRRGWRLTMLALVSSTIAALLFVLAELGLKLPLFAD